jgi:Xaa-Pro aminopeptidase
MFKGYYGDASRTAYLGRPDGEFAKLYRDLYEAYMNGVKAIRTGNRSSDVDSAVRDALRRNDYPIYNMSMGHGLGMKVLELPWIAERRVSKELDMILKPGMVISLEPETYTKKGFARIEDMILVTETGNELLTKTPYLSDLL